MKVWKTSSGTCREVLNTFPRESVVFFLDDELLVIRVAWLPFLPQISTCWSQTLQSSLRSMMREAG